MIVWTFVGDNLAATHGANSAQWPGRFIDSGRVMVEFVAMGRPASLITDIVVKPRETGIWAPAYWETRIEYFQGELPESCVDDGRPAPGIALGRIGARPGVGIPECSAQSIQPADMSGYVLAQGEGPNVNGWFVESTTFRFHSASNLNPAVGPSAAGDTLANESQASLCRAPLGLPSGAPVVVNFWQYNAVCRNVSGWSGFLNAVWNHERGHFDQAESALLSPEHNLYAALEQVVESSEHAAHIEVTDVYGIVQDAASAAAAPQPTGNWSTPFWVWSSQTINSFVANFTSFAEVDR